MDTHRPEVQSPEAALGPLPSLPGPYSEHSSSLQAFSDPVLSPDSMVTLGLQGVTKPSQEHRHRHKDPEPLTAPACKTHHAMRPQNLVSTQAFCPLTIAALTAHPPATTSTHGGGRGGGRAWGNPEKRKADGVGLGNTGRAHALSTGQLLLSPGRRGHGKVHPE